MIILSIEKDLKGEGEAALRERLDQLVRQGHLQILIDLRHVPHVDSSELGRLIRAHISVRQAGGRVRLCNLSDRVMDRVFRSSRAIHEGNGRDSRSAATRISSRIVFGNF